MDTTSEKVDKQIKPSNKPKSWQEFTRNYKVKEGRMPKADAFACMETLYMRGFANFDTREETLAFFALGKLIQLRDAWWGDWKPVWKIGTYFPCIARMTNTIITVTATAFPKTLVFPTNEMRDEFYDTFKDLIEEAQMFL